MLSPLVKAFSLRLPPNEKKRVSSLARKYSKKWKLSEARKRWRAQIPTEDKFNVPMLTLEDFSEVPFIIGISGVDWYQLRSRTRAGDGDFFAATKPELRDYEDYNRDQLGLGDPGFLFAGESGVHDYYVSLALKKKKECFNALVKAAKENRLKMVHPYMGVKDAWKLAKAVSKASGKTVKVLSAYPELTAAVNNKADFTELVEELFGQKDVALTLGSKSIRKTAKNLTEMAARFPRVALKMNCYSSAMGNQVYNSGELNKLDFHEMEKLVAGFAIDHEWNEKDPILAVEWKHDVLQSPSIQTWIPPKGKGLPTIEGIYEQFLKGEHCVFQGSSPSALPDHVQKRMAKKGFLLACIFQEMGYVGRCSFDLVLCGESEEESYDVFVECNGRWGGTSIPMSFINRIIGDYRKFKYRCMDFSDERLKGKPFSLVKEILGDDLYDKRTGKGRFILYNVGCLKEFGKFTCISFGKSRDEAFDGILNYLPKKIDQHFRA